MENVSEAAVTNVWIISLVIGLVVTLVVATLLILIRNTARDIRAGVQQIWTEGKLVANNTIQIPIYLTVTNQVAAKIYAAAAKIIDRSAAIEQHAEGCPGCPACILEHPGDN
ncbi:hypothetical protein [Persicitalea sp.]|uniref:hypothetical protein n=1 Tax=Persicitalea sp. TaxID=3100273 RepID=UPI0035947D73